MRILVVDDEPAVRRSVRSALTLEGYEVRLAREGAEPLEVLASERVAAIVLAVLMPGVDGLEVCRRLRADGDPPPVLMLTVRNLVSDRVAGLDAGGDDYLTKPFSLDELLARMRALLRRDVAREDNVLRHRTLALDTAARTLTQAGRSIDLSAREFALLAALLERPGAALSKAQLEERIYRWGEEVESNAVEVHVHHLRKKLGADTIRTIRGVGYALA